MREAEIQSQILVAVSALPGVIVWRQNSGLYLTQAGQMARSAVPGCPDIIGCYRGRAIGLEVKSETGRQSAQQKSFQAVWERAGGFYAVVRSPSDAIAALARA